LFLLGEGIDIVSFLGLFSLAVYPAGQGVAVYQPKNRS
jgi:hypothetical protein